MRSLGNTCPKSRRNLKKSLFWSGRSRRISAYVKVYSSKPSALDIMTSKGLFIFGYMYSGTSLLQRILSRHPSIYAEQKELKFLQSITRIKQLYPDLTTPSKKREYIAFCTFAIKNALKVSSDLSKVPLQAYIEKSQHIRSDSLDHFGIYFDTYEQLAGDSRYWLDGSPNNVFYHAEIRRLRPEAKFIAIVRDVRDVLASKKKRRDTATLERYDEQILTSKKLEKGYSCIADSLSWKSTYALCNMVASRDSDTLLIRYEDLTQKPECAVKQLCEFLEIEYLDHLLNIRFSNSADPSRRSSGIFTNSGNYRFYLKSSEICAAQSITKKLLKVFEYQLEPVSFSSKIQSSIPWLKFLPQMISRIWNRYRLLGLWNFIAFMKLNVRKLTGG